MNFRTIHTSIVLLLALTVITGVFYPLLITAIARLAFPTQANGSLVNYRGTVAGTELIGQSFTSNQYFWGRPSATRPSPYNGRASSGSNLGPLHPALLDSVRARVLRLSMDNPTDTRPVPVDLVTASASGLDPHISVEAALYQVPRIARTRSMDEDQVRRLVVENTEGRQWGFLGEPRVNVLLLNIALDKHARTKGLSE